MLIAGYEGVSARLANPISAGLASILGGDNVVIRENAWTSIC